MINFARSPTSDTRTPHIVKDGYKELIGVDYDENEPKDKISIGEMFGYFIEIECYKYGFNR